MSALDGLRKQLNEKYKKTIDVNKTPVAQIGVPKDK